MFYVNEYTANIVYFINKLQRFSPISNLLMRQHIIINILFNINIATKLGEKNDYKKFKSREENMDIWDKIKKLSGYQSGDGGIDSYGVDHSGFSVRDELEYQNARLARENQLAENFSKQGIAEENYPQFGTNFWGGTPENNYGFGTSNIKQNIENATNRLNAGNFGATNNGQGLVANTINNAPNNYGYSSNSSLLQPDTLTTQGTQYAKMATPNTATGADDNKAVDYTLYGDGFSQEFIDQMLGDSRFQKIMKSRTQGNEGGYSNHPNDRGGETKYGISSRWYPNEDIPNLTRERANAILYKDYWIGPRINQLPDEFADIVFDNGVVQGQSTAITNLQRALGVHADGLIGPNTLNAISNADKNVRRNFIQQVHQRNKNIVTQNPSQRIFLNGWMNRANNY